ncbi:MAG: hypothetical protein BJ554DRAFT_6915 [Olpidium bornovanus]|uniref:Uncharacterized protein n=1 Tax=Olpidium bornovanus TaxID=278681 RepID=A0A8H8A1P0_9FUNG|nr:MAG: hypothetical protein BJ554DRAFT_6915 [Olpidium bornovanus]
MPPPEVLRAASLPGVASEEGGAAVDARPKLAGLCLTVLMSSTTRTTSGSALSTTRTRLRACCSFSSSSTRARIRSVVMKSTCDLILSIQKYSTVPCSSSILFKAGFVNGLCSPRMNIVADSANFGAEVLCPASEAGQGRRGLNEGLEFWKKTYCSRSTLASSLPPAFPLVPITPGLRPELALAVRADLVVGGGGEDLTGDGGFIGLKARFFFGAASANPPAFSGTAFCAPAGSPSEAAAADALPTQSLPTLSSLKGTGAGSGGGGPDATAAASVICTSASLSSSVQVRLIDGPGGFSLRGRSIGKTSTAADSGSRPRLRVASSAAGSVSAIC